MKKNSFVKKIGYLTGALVISLSVLPDNGQYKVEASGNTKVAETKANAKSMEKVVRIVKKQKPERLAKRLEMLEKMKARRAYMRSLPRPPVLLPTPPTPKPDPVKPTKEVLLSGSASDKILLNAISTDGTGGKLFTKEGSAYYATLLKSTDHAFSARYNVAFVYHDAGKPYSMMINTKVYRDNPHLRKEADKAVLVATQAFFGVNNSASNEMLKFIKDNMNASGNLEKTVTFGGNKATANISKYDIKIRFN